ncbi:uncharacterized protein [Lolium perenne]|uniref:uncharacterized protein n=1 Tax=Lolium perenne TaxID=4522 RepID=UPI003A99CA20
MPYKLLQEITNNFSEEQRLGSGAFGEVYKGVLEGKEIAVKKLRSMQGINEKLFETEFGHLKRLKHQNIVQLVGFCREEEEVVVNHEGKEVCALYIHRALCLEYMPNGSLGNCLSGQYLGHNWQVHFRIIKGICEGLKYLHDVSIMHFDLKPDNILLDGDMVPKIADFGLSRLVGQQNTIMTMSPLGTLGFLPPEFINKQVISKEYDIFSLGAIIKRIVTGAMDKESIPDMDQPEYAELDVSGCSTLVLLTYMCKLKGLFGSQPHFAKLNFGKCEVPAIILMYSTWVVTKGILEDGTKIVVEKLEENSSMVPHKAFHYEIGESCRLDWNTRFRIIMGICQGMHFLQKKGGPPVRLELNPNNIFLDKNMVPKIAGYGVGRLLNHASQMNRRPIVGTSVYKPTQYYKEGSIFLGKAIYYLGILIVEIATGEKYNVRNVYRDWTDEGIEWNYSSLDTTGINQVKACMQIGLMCVETNTRRAPTIKFIVNNLRKTTYFGAMPEKFSSVVSQLSSAVVPVVQIRSGSISFVRVQPRRLCFPYESKRLTSCSLYLINNTLFRVVFSLQTKNPRRYYTKLPFCGIVPPKCSYTLTVTMLEQKKNATFSSHEFLTLQSSIVPGQQLKNVNADSVAAFFEEVRKMAGSSSNKRKIVCEVQEVRIPVVCNPPEMSTSDQIIASPNYRQVLSIDVHPTKPWILTTNNRGNASIWNYETNATVNSLEVNITEEPGGDGGGGAVSASEFDEEFDELSELEEPLACAFSESEIAAFSPSPVSATEDPPGDKELLLLR